MTRPIKFRAWTENSKRHPIRSMWSWEELVSDMDSEVNWHKSVLGLGLTYETPIVRLMQFTNLLDKHGKEIYEGDVVKFWSHPSKMKVCSVFWNAGAARWAVETIENPVEWHTFGHVTTVEVIGNIYENPELLNQKVEETKVV